MKKILSVILAAVMILSTFAVLSVSAEEASASAGTEGNWEVHLDAFEESKLENGEECYMPLPGYEYTDDGFEVVPPVYSNVQAKYTVISKTKYSTKNFSIKIRVDEFDTTGDSWISFTFWSEKNGLAQGGNQDGSYGYGWTSLVRDCENFGKTDGMFSYLEGYSQGTKEAPGGFTTLTTKTFEPVVDDDGNQIIEFKVENSLIYINGVKIDQDNAVWLRNAFKNDEYLAYFGISVKSGLADTPVKFTILEVDGVKPTGSDSAEPVNRSKEFGEMIDASTLPEGTPGVLFDATCENQNTKLPSTTKCSTSLTDIDTIKVTAGDVLGAVGFVVRNDYTVDIKDFPYIAIVLKNYCTCPKEEGKSLEESCYFDETSGFFYCAGSILAPDNDHRISVGDERMVNVTPEGSEDYYILVYAKVDTEEFEGADARIHSLRFDFAGVQSGQEFEIMYAGYFGSVADMVSYATSEGYDVAAEDIEFKDPDDGIIDVDPGVDDDDPVDDGSGEETTTKKEKTTTAASDDSDKKSGCGSVVGMGAIAIVAVASVAGIVTFKKKKED